MSTDSDTVQYSTVEACVHVDGLCLQTLIQYSTVEACVHVDGLCLQTLIQYSTVEACVHVALETFDNNDTVCS